MYGKTWSKEVNCFFCSSPAVLRYEELLSDSGSVVCNIPRKLDCSSQCGSRQLSL